MRTHTVFYQESILSVHLLPIQGKATKFENSGIFLFFVVFLGSKSVVVFLGENKFK